jgi:hypothetical protein
MCAAKSSTSLGAGSRTSCPAAAVSGADRFDLAALRGGGHQPGGGGFGGAAGLGHQVHHGLADPPHRRMLKLDFLRRIETSRRFDQPEVAFVNQVEQRHAEVTEPLGVMHDDAQVRLHEARERIFITVLLKAPAKLTLVIRCQRGKV